ncbi:hypothetical protein QVD17_05957 [Tagetes erecta]|uniref:Uncharacterized protein n=1 Tax=Tagetes erecta TaxID=13708 RepID=A0AAD8PBV6_TARER|nr:hypothetical protein QVD17_05957 [Tagetes erecta]
MQTSQINFNYSAASDLHSSFHPNTNKLKEITRRVAQDACQVEEEENEEIEEEASKDETKIKVENKRLGFIQSFFMHIILSKSFKDDIKYGTAQAKLSEDETLRVAYKSGTPLEAGKIADSDPIDLFSAAHNISNQQQQTSRLIAESKPVDLFSSARGITNAKNKDDIHDEERTTNVQASGD